MPELVHLTRKEWSQVNDYTPDCNGDSGLMITQTHTDLFMSLAAFWIGIA